MQDDLFKVACRAYCMKCSNFRTLTLGSKEYSGCACDMDPTKCVLNPLIQQLKARQEAK